MSRLHEIDDVSPLRGLFRDVDVIPDTVDLHDIVIDRDGPVVHLRADGRHVAVTSVRAYRQGAAD